MAQRRTGRLSGLDVQLKPLLNGGPSHWSSEAIGQQWLIWFETGKPQPGTDVLNGFLPERDHALLSALTQQLHGTVIVLLHVLDPDGESFGDAGSGEVPDAIGVSYFPSRSGCPASHRSHRCVSPVLPRCAIPYRPAAQREWHRYASCHPKRADARQIEVPLVMRLLNNSDSFIFAKGCLPGSLDLSQDLLSFSPPDVALGFEVMPGEVLHDGID